MKTLLLSFLIIGSSAIAQTTRVSTADGDFLNPFNWNPIGVPASGDHLTINHDMIMTTGIYYTAGTIVVSALGSLMEDATDRDFWVDGTGSLLNYGTFKAHTLLASPNTTVYNYGTFSQLDSVWTQTNLVNIGTMDVYDMLNDEQATFTNEGTLIITHDFNNQGRFENKQWASIDLTHDFSNCNLQNLDAVFRNDGLFCIGNNLANCLGDTLKGIGHYYIGNSASNLGVLDGTATLHTPSGNFAISGNVGSGVTITTGACALDVAESEQEKWSIFPNPAATTIAINTTGDYAIMSSEGKVVLSGKCEGEIHIGHLQNGIYLLSMNGKVQKFMKQ